MRGPLTGAALVAAAVLITAGAGLAVTANRVSGTSMTPTLADGELVAGDPLRRRPERFDVVVLAPAPGQPQLVKRVVGLPGDRVEIVAAGGAAPRVRVAPAGAEHWYEVRTVGGIGWRGRTECCTPDGRTSPRPAQATVPPERYFVLGDNPDASVDSRSFGWVAADTVRAVVVGRLWPPSALPEPPTLVAAR